VTSKEFILKAPVLTALVAALALVFGACPNPAASGTNNAPIIVSDLELTALVTAPVKDAAPDTTEIDADQYTGTIEWRKGNNSSFTGGTFAPSTVYKAVVTLTAKPGFTFNGVEANSFVYNGATVTNGTNSGRVTISFPATADIDEDTPVNALSLNDLVTAPVKGSIPDTAAINTDQYTGTIVWQNEDGSNITEDYFAPSTVYKAVVTLTAKPRYTFNGVEADSFRYNGATATNEADSGTVTITFKATAGIDEDTPVNALSLNALVVAPVEGAAPVTTTINKEQYTGTIAWQNADGSSFTGNFVKGAVYKAVVTLTAKPGFTFNDFAANSFVHDGAIAVTNATNSGTVTIAFLATAVLGSVTRPYRNTR
jgi:hypothetical protein